ncbi:hypothetical protein GCM10009682_40470 [Luedemannella flava]|uniref:Uncharacterized protein n=1 Tax=Luedemannella flava TaxID=349316 RepID=A0ABN2M9C7_9ACTN
MNHADKGPFREEGARDMSQAYPAIVKLSSRIQTPWGYMVKR